MGNFLARADRFKWLFLNNKFVIFLLVLLLIGLNIWVLNHIPFVFKPAVVLVKTVVLPLLLAGIAYYLLNPVVDWLERRGVRRIFSIALLYLAIVFAAGLIVSKVIPIVREQIVGLIHNAPHFIREIQFQLEQRLGSEFFYQLQSMIGLNSDDWINTMTEKLSGIANRAGQSIGGFLGAVTEIVLAVVTLPFILFYLLKDGRKLPSYILHFVPIGFREQTHRVMAEMNHQISSYIRGQIIVSFCIGFLLFVGYRIIGLDYSLVLATIAAFTSVVPYLGPAIAITPALIVALVTSPVMLLKMIVIWTIVQLVEGKFISPQIMGKTLQIHPVTIIFVILTAGNLFGVWGILLAVPGYAVLKVICTHLFAWFKRRSGLYEPAES